MLKANRETKKEMLTDVDKEIASSRKIRYCTVEIEYADGSQAIRHHHTDIITWLPNGNIRLNTDGYKTKSTKTRLNDYLPAGWYIRQKNYVWYLNTPYDTYEYYDGMTFTPDGELITEERHTDTEEIEELKSDISDFCDLIYEVEELPEPSNGDCWFCAMQAEDGQTLGDKMQDNDHLKNHIEEGYLHGSLIVNALLYVGYRRQQVGLFYHLDDRDIMRRALYRYLTEKLIKHNVGQ